MPITIKYNFFIRLLFSFEFYSKIRLSPKMQYLFVNFLFVRGQDESI